MQYDFSDVCFLLAIILICKNIILTGFSSSNKNEDEYRNNIRSLSSQTKNIYGIDPSQVQNIEKFEMDDIVGVKNGATVTGIYRVTYY